MFNIRRLTPALALVALISFSGCSSLPQSAAEKAEYRATNDPFEPVNRVIFDVNDFMDRLLIRPLAELYRITVPPPLRDRIAGIIKNMSEPVIFANNLLQGEGTRAGTTAARFLVNTTIGVGGMFEVANDLKLPRQSGDFGETLYVWGLPEGPYIVLPLFGPSNVRDAIGLGVDSVMSPWKYVVAYDGNAAENVFMASDMLVGGIVKREENIEALDALREGSLDFYAQLRSVYRQHRAKQLGAPLPTGMPAYEDLDVEQTEPVFH
jgi:phospholipid-binding lipoprotein MlaA